jgi:acyl-CoA dehydrogenase
MRGTASHSLVMDKMFVPDAAVSARRPPGEFAPVLAIIVAKALPVIAATYLGVAQAARDSAVGRIAGTPMADDPGVRRRIGLMDHHLRRARWTLDGSMSELGDDPDPTPATLGTATMAKRSAIEDARAVGELAMDVLGGRVYRHGDPVERAWRDLRAGPYHPLDHELTLRVLGDLALDRPISLR